LEIDHPLDLNNAKDMGKGTDTYACAAAPSRVVYDIAVSDNSANTVTALHGRGARVVYYFDAETCQR
jgi:hypothetical protein